jgi:AmmeMemoRadiSam system protein B
MPRPPAVAGQFYDATARGLKAQIEASYRHKVGPGALPAEPKPWPAGRPWAYIVPHAGYVFSGPVAAHAFLDIARRGVPDTVIIVGPSHHRISHDLAVSLEGWRTPLGVAECDVALAKQLVGGPVAHCDGDFALEHSLEVEVPFMQHLAPSVRIAPLIMLDQSLEAAKLVGARIAQVIAANPRKSIGVLASTDFTHYESAARAAAQDQFALEAIARGSAADLDRAVREHDISMCGPGPTMAVFEALKPKSTRLLKYANSADAEFMKGMAEVVAYAAICVA